MLAKRAGSFFFKAFAELGGDLAGKDADRHEELAPGWLPMFAIGGNPTAGDEHVDVGVIAQTGVAAMQEGQNTGLTPRGDVSWRRVP